MSSIVEQLQIEALDQSVPVSDLLRKAKVVAFKLELDEFLKWIESELDGYSSTEVPSYRHLVGEPKAWNPFHGWQPLMTNSAELQRKMSEFPIGQSVPELEELLRIGKNTLHVPFLPEHKILLLKAIDFQTEILRHVDRSQFARILSAVRNIILDWSLKLEKAGIKGEGVSFKENEKERVGEAKINYHIDNIQYLMGSIGNVSGQASQSFTQVNLDVDIPGLKNLVGQIKEYMDELDLNDRQKEMLKKTTEDLEQELKRDTPRSSKIREFGSSIKRVLEGAAGNIVASGIIHMLNKGVGTGL